MNDKRGYMNKSKTEEWETNWDLYNKLNKIFKFKVDLAASDDNSKCKHYITKEVDSLKIDWNIFKGENMWLNPPYGKQLKYFVKKANETEYENNCLCMLIPASTETKHFQEIIFENAKLVIFIKGRLKFLLNGKEVGSSTKGSSLVVFGDIKKEQVYNLFDLELGKVFITDEYLNGCCK